MSPEIVALDDFRDECRHLVANGRVFQLVLSELVHQGEVCFRILTNLHYEGVRI